MQRHGIRYRLILRVMILMCPLFSTALSQQPVPTSPPEELVPIEFSLKGDGRAEVTSLQRDNRVYLSVQSIFDFLRVKNVFSQTEGTISGFFVTPDTPYVIDASQLRARVGRVRTALLPEDVTIRGAAVYLRVELFERLFGLPIVYNARTLKASLSTPIPLPVFLDSKIRHLESQLASRPAQLKPDATFDRAFSLINGGQLDYSFRQTLSSAVVPSRTFFTRLTGMLVGGDAEARFVGNLSGGIDITQTRVHWRYVPTPNGSLFKQYVAGDFVTSGLLSREMYGVQLTNHPANPRIYFADETISGRPETNRGVYLFEGSRLSAVDRDAADRYDLRTSLRYGVNYVDVREFGEWGETFSTTYRIAVPPTLVPPGELDYDVVLGRLRDVGDPWHGELSSQWGISSRVTAGVRMEYYGHESLPTKVFPDFNFTTRLTDHLIGEALLSPNAFLRGSLDLTLPSLVSAVLTYTDFRSVRLFNPRDAINEASGHVVLPFSLNGMRLAFDLSGTQTILNSARERRLRGGLSAFLGPVSPRLTTQYAWNHEYGSDSTLLVFHETEASIRVRLPANLFVSFSAPFNHIAGKFRNFRAGVLIQPVSNLLLEFEYDRNFVIQSTFARIRLQYTAPFTRVVAGATRSGEAIIFDQSVSGSFGAVPELGQYFFDNNPSRAGYGSMLIAPFVDTNMNGVRDPGEQIISSAKLRGSTMGEGGFRLTSLPDIGWVIPRATPYQNYLVELPQIDLENPLWIPRYRVIEANAAPGTYTYISIPVITGGSLRGTVLHLKGPTLQEGVEFVKVNVREEVNEEELMRTGRQRFERTVETFSTGDFELVGVPPGKYTVSLDGLQLAALRLQGRQLTRNITVETKPDGDIVEGVNFVLIDRK